MCWSTKFWCLKGELFLASVSNTFCPEAIVLEHQSLVLKGQKVSRSSFQLFLFREKGVAAPNVGI